MIQRALLIPLSIVAYRDAHWYESAVGGCCSAFKFIRRRSGTPLIIIIIARKMPAKALGMETAYVVSAMHRVDEMVCAGIASDIPRSKVGGRTIGRDGSGIQDTTVYPRPQPEADSSSLLSPKWSLSFDERRHATLAVRHQWHL